MATLAEMLGGVSYPVQQMERQMVRLFNDDRPAMQQSIDGEENLMAQMVDLEKSILFQSAIGK